MRSIGKWLLGDRRHAAGAAFAFSAVPYFGIPVGFIASVIIGLVALRNGWKDALFVVFWAVIPAAALMFLGHNLIIVDALVFHFVFIAILALLLQQYQSWSLVLEASIPIGLFIIAVLHLFVAATPEFWVINLTKVMTNLQQAQNVELSAEQVSNIIGNIALIANGVVAVLVLMSNIVNLLLARGLQAMMFKPGGLMNEFCQIRIGWLVSIFSLIVLVIALMKYQLAYEVLLVLCLPYAIAGLSLAHASVQHGKNKMPLLFLLYASLLLLSFYAASLLVLIGFFDSWYDVRRRHARFRVASS